MDGRDKPGHDGDVRMKNYLTFAGQDGLYYRTALIAVSGDHP
jgi:hypothetical protein